MTATWNRVVLPLLSLLLGLALALVLVAILGENPLHVLEVMYEGAFGSPTDFGYVLYYSTPLFFTGLSVAWAFRAGLFNIGGEGQMILGGTAMAIAGILFPDLPRVLAWPLAILSGFLAGGLWGALAGWIKAKRGCHEVLITILLNFVSYGVSGFFILHIFKNPNSQVPETAPVGAGFLIPALPKFLSGGSPANYSLLFAFLMLVLYALIMNRTRFGLTQRMVGRAPELARRSGVDLNRQMILSLFIAGGIAALGAVSPVLGFAGKAREGFAGGLGFVGVAVALLARNSAVGILLSSFLFGALMKGALDLDLDTDFVSRDLSTVIEALIVLAVASQAGLHRLFLRGKK